MKQINKGAPPAQLVTYALQGGRYADYPYKPELLEILVAEQRGICCYCMKRIEATYDSSSIEHWASQALHPDRELDYSNLLAVCLGNATQAPARHHCDKSKGGQDITVNPTLRVPNVEDLISYDYNGKVSSALPEIDHDLKVTLNLNLATLVNARRAVWKEVLHAHRLGLAKKADKQRVLDKWNGTSSPGALQPYCGMITYIIAKWLS